MKTKIVVLIVIASIYGCKTATERDNLKGKERLSLTFESKSGSDVKGNAVFTENKGAITINATFSGLKPGIHAIHIHEKADCSASDASSAGGHWNPTFKSHGKWGSSSYHRGDIGNFTTDQYGNGSITMTTNEWCIGCGDAAKDILGKGLIVHEKADDYVTQPTGDAGGRVACTAIIK